MREKTVSKYLQFANNNEINLSPIANIHILFSRVLQSYQSKIFQFLNNITS